MPQPNSRAEVKKAIVEALQQAGICPDAPRGRSTIMFRDSVGLFCAIALDKDGKVIRVNPKDLVEREAS